MSNNSNFTATAPNINRETLYANHGLSSTDHGSDRFMAALSIRDEISNQSKKLAELIPMPDVRNPHWAYNKVVNASGGTDYLNEAANAVLRGESPDVLLSLYAGTLYRENVAVLLRDAHKEFFVNEVMSHSDQIIETLAEEAFTPMVTGLQNYVDKYGANVNIQDALKAKDYEQAAEIDKAEILILKIGALHKARTTLHGSAFNDLAAWVTAPQPLDGIGDPTSKQWEGNITNDENITRLAWWTLALSRGAQFHFPTLEQWDETRRSEAFNPAEPEDEASTDDDGGEQPSFKADNRDGSFINHSR